MAKKSVKIPKSKAIYYAKKDILGRSIAKSKPPTGQKKMVGGFLAIAKRKAKRMTGWKAIKSKINK